MYQLYRRKEMAIIDAQDNEVFPAPENIPTRREELEKRYNRGVIVPEGEEVPDFVKKFIETGKVGGVNEEVDDAKLTGESINETDQMVKVIKEVKDTETAVEPIPEHEIHRHGDSIQYTDLMRRIEMLEDRFNKLITAISKSKKVTDI
jgi:hypothetical protein